jgi:hypothetical protein
VIKPLIVISTYEEKINGQEKRNRSLPLKAKVANQHKLRQSNAAVVSVVGRGGVFLQV